MTAPLRIALVWHALTSANLGVRALSAANAEIVRAAARRAGVAVELEWFGWGGTAGAASEPFLQISSRDLLSPRSRFRAAIGRCQLAFDIGEGDSFTDLYGWRRFGAQALSKAAILLAGVPLVLSPQTIGPFRSRGARLAARRLCAGARRVFVRDELSLAYCVEARLAPGAALATDVAFRLPYTRPRQPADGDRRLRVGLNVSGLLFRNGYDGRNALGLATDYRALVFELARALVQRADTRVYLVSHVAGDGNPEDDFAACRAVHERVPQTVLTPPFASAEAAKSMIAGLDFFTGARMHACIAAFSAGVPVVPMAYSRKFTGLFASLGVPAIADATREDAPALVATVLRGLDERAALAVRVAAGRARAMALLDGYEVAVAELLLEVAARAAPQRLQASA
jgi:polysaccharide pyruvyl transferase WcaK-like protein